MDWEEALKTIEAILKRGNDAEIRRKNNGYIVLEVKKTIKYISPVLLVLVKCNRSRTDYDL